MKVALIINGLKPKILNYTDAYVKAHKTKKVWKIERVRR